MSEAKFIHVPTKMLDWVATQKDAMACPVCGSDIEPYPQMVEVFETLECLVCEDCHEGALQQWAEDNGQFGMGA